MSIKVVNKMKRVLVVMRRKKKNKKRSHKSTLIPGEARGLLWREKRFYEKKVGKFEALEVSKRKI